jgi:hypothetical protein
MILSEAQRNRIRSARRMMVVRILLVIMALIMTHMSAPRAAVAQSQSSITSPSAGSGVSGDVPVMGNAVIDPFQKYELHYKLEPSGDDAFIYFDGGTAPVVNGQLGIWRASGLPSGTYTLRLRVVKLDGNYAEFFSPNLSVNQGPVPTATSDQPTPTPIPTATFTPAPQPTVAVGQVEQPEGVVNPLVPTPTPTATPGAVAVQEGGIAASTGQDSAGAVENENSLTRQINDALGVERLRESFFTGVRYAATLFILLVVIYAGRRLFTWVRTRA